MMYDIEFRSVNGAIGDFTKVMSQLQDAAEAFNQSAIHSKRNRREILDLTTDGDHDEILCIRIYSQKSLKEGCEGNSLQRFSKILVDDYGFGVYLNSNGKLFRSAA